MNFPTNDVIGIIRETRGLTLPHFGNIEIKSYKSSEAKDAVTEIDQLVEKQLKATLQILLPDVSFVGEEYSGDRESDKFWLVDPIDATGHYIRGIPFCTTMVALIDNGQVVFSAIYDFVRDDIYYAELGKGAYKNAEKISVSTRPLQKSYISCEINSKKEENRDMLSAIGNKANILHTLSAGYEFILVASGKIEGRVVYDGFGKDYDFAAGSLLVSEAGGVVRNFKSDGYDYRNLNFVAVNPLVYDELVGCEDGIEKFMK